MSKEVNDNNKISIIDELKRKQLLDSIIYTLGIIAIGGFACWLCGADAYKLFSVIAAALVVILALSAFSTNAVKKSLNKVITETLKTTIDSVNNVQITNSSQKKNNLISDNKIRNAQELIDSLQKRSSIMNELTNQINEKTTQSLDYTNNEYDAVKTNIEKMFSIRHKIQTIAELILELSDFVQSISSTIGLVEDIAEQTNLLALNAAVEAARAGEHGKGFAVVASEIRKLADESKQATTKIISLINDIQQTANSTVLATEEGTKEIESGLELAHNISENVEQLINVMNEISSNMIEIINSSKLINVETKETDEFIKELSVIVEDNQKLTLDSEAVFEQIQITSNDLKKSVS